MDLHVSVCAVLLAEACKISLTEVAQPSMLALSYNRLAGVRQNYVRAETIAAANEHLLGVYAHIPLVQDVRIVGDDWTHACEFVAQEYPPDFLPCAGIRAHQPAGPQLRLGNDPRPNTAACATTTKLIRRRSPITVPDPAGTQSSGALAVAVGYRSRREPRPDRSPRSQRSFALSATYGNSASSRARLTARATWF